MGFALTSSTSIKSAWVALLSDRRLSAKKDVGRGKRSGLTHPRSGVTSIRRRDPTCIPSIPPSTASGTWASSPSVTRLNLFLFVLASHFIKRPQVTFTTGGWKLSLTRSTGVNTFIQHCRQTNRIMRSRHQTKDCLQMVLARLEYRWRLPCLRRTGSSMSLQHHSSPPFHSPWSPNSTCPNGFRSITRY